MNLLGINTFQNVRLQSRNEGKIKTYESCTDVRAWSHDLRTKDRYLREWMKRDMPICVIPVYTLSSFLKTMTCRSRARATPRCHPDCKSKVLLESICNSCHAIKECLQDEPEFDKYFAEEEFETSHWPCDKCLDVLKSIKMFWRIIVEKIFGVNISKTESFANVQDSRTQNVKSVAKLWEKELIQQALFVKNVTPLLSRGASSNKSDSSWQQPYVRKEATTRNTRIPRPCKTDPAKDSLSSNLNQVKSPTNSIPPQRTRASNIGRSSGSSSKTISKGPKKIHRCTSVRVRMVDQSCETSNIEVEREELKTYQKNVEILQQKCNVQDSEIDKLKRENNSLKIELQNFYKSSSWRSSKQFISSPNYDKAAVVPKPFESFVDDTAQASCVKNIDSEMIITMKNCRNESYKHVSLLQVLHKTNDPPCKEEDMTAAGSKKENPIDLLNKVQNTFGEIVRREIMLNNKRHSTKQSDIDANFFKLKNSKSAPSCSTIISQCTTSSESNFVSM